MGTGFALVAGIGAGAMTGWPAPGRALPGVAADAVGTGQEAAGQNAASTEEQAEDQTGRDGADRSRARAHPPAPAADPVPVDLGTVDAAGLTLADRQAGLLSAEVPSGADGTLVVVPGSVDAPRPDRPVRTVRVEVEAGLDMDPTLFARTVMATLNDTRGWGADGSVSFARTDADADLRVVLASPDLVDQMCAPLRTAGVSSCGRYGHAALNHMRWVRAADGFTDRAVYRRYLVNHEVGHLLGHPHVACPGTGLTAPVMQQQTYGLDGCLANGWPFPDAA